jgi:hypothetical protein
VGAGSLKEICFLGKQEIKKQMINVNRVSSGNKNQEMEEVDVLFG